MAATLDRIKSLLSSQLGIKEDRIQLKSRILEDLGADSLDLVELLMTLEDEFNSFFIANCNVKFIF